MFMLVSKFNNPGCAVCHAGALVNPALSCLKGTALKGTTLLDTSVAANPSQDAQLCAEACRLNQACEAFSVDAFGCTLWQLSEAKVATVPDTHTELSCILQPLTFVSLGRSRAVTAGLPSNTTIKCAVNQSVGMDVLAAVAGVASMQQCAAACAARTACTAFILTDTGHCTLGNNVASGTNIVPAGPAANLTSCALGDADWLRFGSLADPSTVSVVNRGYVYSLHPEQLSYDAAAAACTSLSSHTTLASFADLAEAGYVASKLLVEAQSLQPFVPAANVTAGAYGAWVGLRAPGPSLLALLNGSSASLTWEDGRAVAAMVLQGAWVVDKTRTQLEGLPGNGDTCVSFSTDRSLPRAGLSAASPCDWAMPFICKGVCVGGGGMCFGIHQGQFLGIGNMHGCHVGRGWALYVPNAAWGWNMAGKR